MPSIELIIALTYLTWFICIYYLTYFTMRFGRTVVAKELIIFIYTLPWMYWIEQLVLKDVNYTKRQKFRPFEKYLYLAFGSINALILFLIGKGMHVLYNIILFS